GGARRRACLANALLGAALLGGVHGRLAPPITTPARAAPGCLAPGRILALGGLVAVLPRAQVAVRHVDDGGGRLLELGLRDGLGLRLSGALVAVRLRGYGRGRLPLAPRAAAGAAAGALPWRRRSFARRLAARLFRLGLGRRLRLGGCLAQRSGGLARTGAPLRRLVGRSSLYLGLDGGFLGLLGGAAP